MIKDFDKNLSCIKNEFEEAVWDDSTGISGDELLANLRSLAQEIKDEPTPMIIAKLYEYNLDNARLQINPKTPFSCKFDFGISYKDTATSAAFSKAAFFDRRNAILPQKLPEEYARMKKGLDTGLGYAWQDFWHTVPDWNNILKLGFKGILDLAKERKEQFIQSGNYTKENIEFFDCVIISFEAILRAMQRVYDASLAYDIPEFSCCIKNLMSNPPKTTYEVMQLAVLYLYFEEVGVERARSLGPVDKLYYPYVKNDIDNGTYTKEEIEELIRYFFMHFTAAKRYAQQPILFCGSDAKGGCNENPLTMMMLNIYDELNIYDPKIHIRYHDGLSDEILTKLLDMIRRGNNSICILNDNAVFKGYEKQGVSIEEAADYVPLGCYEPIIMGKEEAEIGAGRMNIAKPLEYALNNGCDMLTNDKLGLDCDDEYDTFDKLLDGYIKQLDYCLDSAVEFIELQGDISYDVYCSPIYSATFNKCMEKGLDVHRYPAEYNNISIKIYSTATIVDSLMMIKKYVYDLKEISLDDVRNIMKNNWEGYEELKNKIRCDQEKYGNNLDAPDKILCDIMKHITDRYANKPLRRGGFLRLATDSITECIKMGRKCSATLDGRYQGEPLSRNMCASPGQDREGVTALIQTNLKLDASDFLDGIPFDFTIHPSAVSGDEGMKVFKSVVKTYFDAGGFALQGNIVNADTLKDAKLHPENYSNLQIRVCGWNVRFIDLPEDEQNMFIRQFE